MSGSRHREPKRPARHGSCRSADDAGCGSARTVTRGAPIESPPMQLSLCAWTNPDNHRYPARVCRPRETRSTRVGRVAGPARDQPLTPPLCLLKGWWQMVKFALAVIVCLGSACATAPEIPAGYYARLRSERQMLREANEAALIAAAKRHPNAVPRVRPRYPAQAPNGMATPRVASRDPRRDPWASDPF